jgi:hypothetical protein
MPDDPEIDHRPRCSYCRKLVPSVDERADRHFDPELCLCDDKWLPGRPPVPVEPPKPVTG